MKRLFPLIFALLALVFFTGCGENASSKKLRMGVCIPVATHGWAGGVVWHANETKKKLEKANPDLEVIITAAENPADQADKIENLLARNVRSLVVMSQEPGPITGVCEKAVKAGKHLVIVSNPLSRKVEDIFVNGDNKSFGAAAAECMGKLLKGKGSILVMEGTPCPINSDRVNSFKAVLAKKYPNIKILDSKPAFWNTEKGLELMENFLQKYPKVDGVWAGDDDVMKGALKAYQESKRKDVKVFVGGGGAKEVVKLIKDDKSLVKGTVTYSPGMIAKGMEEALSLMRSGKKGRKEILIPSHVVTKENAAKYYFPASVY